MNEPPAGFKTGEGIDELDQNFEQDVRHRAWADRQGPDLSLRQSQRSWGKHRDEGVNSYVSLFPAAEKERRRLQFLGDVTAANQLPLEEWEL